MDGTYRELIGRENVDKLICIDQSPIGRTPRSNPATYVGVFTAIRELFALVPESRARGYKSGRFSFNTKGGRCEACDGDGIKKIEMHFLPDVYVPCEVCKGKRYNRETLEIRYKGKNIADVLDMTVDDAVEFFRDLPAVRRKIDTLQEVGLGYIKLGSGLRRFPAERRSASNWRPSFPRSVQGKRFMCSMSLRRDCIRMTSRS